MVPPGCAFHDVSGDLAISDNASRTSNPARIYHPTLQRWFPQIRWMWQQVEKANHSTTLDLPRGLHQIWISRVW